MSEPRTDPDPLTPAASTPPARPGPEEDAAPAAGSGSPPDPAVDPAPPGRRWPVAALLGLAVALHLALTLYFAPPRVIFGPEPIATVDYSLHAYQTHRALRSFEDAGRLWGYDPQVLAGHPIGALEDLTVKGLELFVIGLSTLGINWILGFNLFILLTHLLVPLIAYGAARLLGLGPAARAVAVLLWVLLWFFDFFVHWCWFCGMISWASASTLAVLLVALVHAAVERNRPRLWLAAAPLGTWLVAVHPFGALAAAPACAAIYLRRVRRLSWPHHLGLLGTVALVAGINGIWIHTFLRFKHLVLELVSFLKPGPITLLYDYLDLLAEPWDTGGAPVRTVFRMLALAPAALVFWRWRKERDPRLLPLGLMVGSTLLLAYFGGLLRFTSQIQPYRLIVPAVLAAALPAAVLLAEIASPAALRALPRSGKLLLLLLVVLVVPRMARTVLINMPEPLPQNHRLFPSQGPLDQRREALTGIFATPPGAMRHHTSGPGMREVRRWLIENHKGRGRVVVQEWVLSEFLAWSTRIPVLGGLEQRALPHGDAHLFRLAKDGDLPGERLRAYLERYAVGFVVVKSILPKLEWRKDLLQFEKLVGGMRIYRTRIQPSYLAKGSGRVTAQDLNRIRVEGAAGEELVLRFHWLETLRCRPGCTAEQYPVKGDRAGFIRVKNPPKTFEIYNGY